MICQCEGCKRFERVNKTCPEIREYKTKLPFVADIKEVLVTQYDNKFFINNPPINHT